MLKYFMGKSLKSKSLILVSSLVLSQNVFSASESATVTISALVVDNTCTPEWNSGGEQLDLGRASLRDFHGMGSSAAEKQIHLRLSDCGPGLSTVDVISSGSPDSGNANLFTNTVTDGAKGVGIAIFGGTDQATAMTPNNSHTSYSVVNSAVDMVFTAKLEQATEASPTPGAVMSTVTFLVNYQ